MHSPITVEPMIRFWMTQVGADYLTALFASALVTQTAVILHIFATASYIKFIIPFPSFSYFKKLFNRFLSASSADEASPTCASNEASRASLTPSCSDDPPKYEVIFMDQLPPSYEEI